MELLFLGKYFSFKACSQLKLTFSVVPYKHNIESYIFTIKKKLQKPSKNTDCLSRNTVCKQLPHMCKILAIDLKFKKKKPFLTTDLCWCQYKLTFCLLTLVGLDRGQ